MTKYDNINFQTPDYICKHMVGILMHYSPKYVLEPTPGAGNLVKALKSEHISVHAPDDFFKDTLKRKYDAVIMNPPFTPMSDGYDILYRCMGLSDIIIALMPWLTLINSKKRTEKIVAYGLVSVTHLPRSVFPGSRVQCCIMEMCRNHNIQTIFKFY